VIRTGVQSLSEVAEDDPFGHPPSGLERPQLLRIDGRITCLGRLGESVSLEQGVEAASVCALNALAVLEAALGSLGRIERFLKVIGFVASSPDFAQQPKVIDGASRIFHDAFGEAGRHAR
jgi:hypothetical protein